MHPRRRRHAEDVLLAAAIAVVGQLEVWAPALSEPSLVGPRPAIATFYALTPLALIARRHAPVPTLAAIAVLDVVQFLTLGGSEGMGTLLPLLVATYSVAAHREGATARAGLVVAVAVVVVHELTNPDNTDLASVLDAAVWDVTVVAAWLAGAYLRTRRAYTAALVDRARRAEREREERARAAVAQERARISRELHDVVAHGVSVMVVQAEGAQELLDTDGAAVERALGRIQVSGREALVELRRMLGMLKGADASTGLAPQPGLAQLDALAAQLGDAGLPVAVRVVGEPLPLAPGLDLSAFRIVQEALTNALKHAGPTRADVVLTYAGDALDVEVRDHGAGGDGVNGTGHGLAGMRERATLFGGTLEVGAAAEGGFRVHAHLPVGRSS